MNPVGDAQKRGRREYRKEFRQHLVVAVGSLYENLRLMFDARARLDRSHAATELRALDG